MAIAAVEVPDAETVIAVALAALQQEPSVPSMVELESTVAVAVPVSQPECVTATQEGEAALFKCASHWFVLSSELIVITWPDAPVKVRALVKVKITPCWKSKDLAAPMPVTEKV